MFIKSLYGTFPIVVHCPNDHPLWETIVNYNFKLIRKYNNANDLTILTWNNTCTKGILERSLDHLGIRYLVLGKEIRNWHNNLKIDLTVDALKDIATKYVMGIDSFDAIFIGDPQEAVKSLSCDILFNATPMPRGSLPYVVEFEDRLAQGHIFHHLNAGAWIGNTNFCKKFFSIASSLKHIFKEIKDFRDSEQVVIKSAFEISYPEADLDRKCSIFQMLNYPEDFPGGSFGISLLNMEL